MMKRDFTALGKQDFDLLVVGGGIYGAWAAYDAALRGLKVAIVEQSDWGSGTSQSSSKLIHGGLRYLEHYDFAMVRKSLAERKKLNRLGPHRVRPLRFVIPNYKSDRIAPLKFRVGLWVYDLLAGSRQPVARHRYLRPAEVKDRWPFLRAEGLRAAFSYGDCVTDDARLVLEIVAGAIEAGAVAVNYSRYQGEHMVADVFDKEGSIKVAAKVILACTGPWCGEISTSVAAAARLVMGSHLVMPRMECDEAFLLTADDGRVFFLVPWYGRTLLGTTESDYHDDPSDAEPREQDIDYLLRNANSVLVGLEWTRADVISCFAGLRTLRNKQGKASSISRDWKLEEPEPGLLVPIGGKLTSARADAAEMIDAVFVSLKRSAPPCVTGAQPFPWCPSVDWPYFLLGCLNRARKLGLDPECAQNMAERFGQQVEKVFALIEAQPELAARIIEDLPFCQAELEYSAQHEMAQTVDDVLRRRVPLQLLVRSEQLVQLHRQVAGYLGV